MREKLISCVGSEQFADECIRRLVSHLMVKGFGDQGKGRIRDFLMRGIRSAAKSAIADLPEEKRPDIDLSNWTLDSPSWVDHWRQGLLNRSWRSLERLEHNDLTKPLHAVLRMATEYPNDDAAMLAVRINTQQSDIKVEGNKIGELFGVARAAFAEILSIEVESTLDQTSPESVMQEIEALQLSEIQWLERTRTATRRHMRRRAALDS